LSLSFFFQAEDGIRDFHVTGVQTCALPISDWPAFFRDRRLRPQFELARRKGRWRRGWDRWAERLLGSLEDLLPRTPERSLLHGEIGRASCRERVESSMAAASVRRKCRIVDE